MTLQVGVVGAGIGGLTQALALHAAGIEASIFECSPRIDAEGAAAELSPNASRILRALHLLDAAQALSFEPVAQHFRDARSSYIIGFIPLGASQSARYGAPHLQILRGDLQQLLYDAAVAREIPITFGAQCIDFTQRDDSVDAHFADSSTRRFDVLIGADGNQSRIRELLNGPCVAHLTGYVGWRGLVASNRLRSDRMPPALTTWLAPRQHLTHCHVRDGQTISFTAVLRDDSWREQAWSRAGDPQRLRDAFAGWHADVQQLLTAVDVCSTWAVTDPAVSHTWSAGHVALIGDACHTLPPSLNQGAAAAIEDAWVLARLLDDGSDAPLHALAEYQHYRQPRARRMQQQARDNLAMLHASSRWARFKRNASLGIGSRLLPELITQQRDWIYSYDAIRGFA